MVTDAQRLDLYTGLVETLGPQRADIMMQLVPSAGWSDVARRSDIDALRAEFIGKFGEVDSKLGEVDSKLGQFEGRLGLLDGKIGRLEGRLYAAMTAQAIALAGLFIASRSLA